MFDCSLLLNQHTDELLKAIATSHTFLRELMVTFESERIENQFLKSELAKKERLAATFLHEWEQKLANERAEANEKASKLKNEIGALRLKVESLKMKFSQIEQQEGKIEREKNGEQLNASQCRLMLKKRTEELILLMQKKVLKRAPQCAGYVPNAECLEELPDLNFEDYLKFVFDRMKSEFVNAF